MLMVQTFGKFQIADGKRIMDADTLRSPMLLRLLMYMILYRDKVLPTEEICEAIWQEENIANPAGALKNLMYRLRKVFAQIFGVEDFILSGRGTYRWNTKVTIQLDADKFEDLIRCAAAEKSDENARAAYETAVWIYQGDFMRSLMDMPWIVPLNSFYQSLFLTAVKDLSALYEKAGQFDLMEKLCTDALMFESGNEQLYCLQIRAMINGGKIDLAFSCFDKVRQIMEKEYGTRSMTELNELYEELLLASKGQIAAPIGEVQKDISEQKMNDVFLCGYPVFKEIYRFEARRISRSDQEESLVLLTFSGTSEPPSEPEEYHIRRAMDALEEIIRESLRVGDAAARYSESQFILLLSSCTRELAMIASNRLITKLHEKNINSRCVNLSINIEKVSSQSEMVN